MRISDLPSPEAEYAAIVAARENALQARAAAPALPPPKPKPKPKPESLAPVWRAIKDIAERFLLPARDQIAALTGRATDVEARIASLESRIAELERRDLNR